MSNKTLHLKIVSQEKQLLDQDVEQVTATTSEGEITVLPEHSPLFAPLVHSELEFVSQGERRSFAVSKGFIDVDPQDVVTVMVDVAVAARDISLEKAEAAVKAAQETIVSSRDRQELIMAEASLRQAMMEIKIAQKSRKNKL